MGLSVIPTNIGGVNIPLGQIQGPLAKLFQKSDYKNLSYPSDLATNPAMGHAVLFEIFDYTTKFQDIADKVVDTAKDAVASAQTNGTTQTVKNAVLTAQSNLNAGAVALLPSALSPLQARTYERTKKGDALTNISLFMPDTLAVNFSSNYQEVSMTDVMGSTGLVTSAITDTLAQNPSGASGYFNAIFNTPGAKQAASAAAGTALGTLPGVNGKTLTQMMQQGLNQYTNPQIQLLYKGINLRTFTLEFIMTPKDSQEAKTVKQICDAFSYYSSPGVEGFSNGSGQYLTPPQIFNISFKFLGGNGLVNSAKTIFKTALNNIGLGFLNSENPTNTVKNAAEAKIMEINDCVLQSVNIDYAPNGWAAYNDGYPIQTRLTLTFKEMQIYTKMSTAARTVDRTMRATKEKYGYDVFRE